jgi:hypothetical protein
LLVEKIGVPGPVSLNYRSYYETFNLCWMWNGRRFE